MKRTDKRRHNTGRPRVVVDQARVGELFAQGQSYAEIAAACKCSTRTVSRTLQRVRTPIRRARVAPLPDFSPAALATMLAAMRLFQQEFDTPAAAVAAFPEHFADHQPLDHEQIDELCDFLNEM